MWIRWTRIRIRIRIHNTASRTLRNRTCSLTLADRDHCATPLCAERVLAGGAGVQERPGRTQQVQDPLDDLSQVSAQLLPARGLPLLLQPSP
jgi:hypothetical protein